MNDDTVARMLGVTQAQEVPADATLAETAAYYRELALRGTEDARKMFQQDPDPLPTLPRAFRQRIDAAATAMSEVLARVNLREFTLSFEHALSGLRTVQSLDAAPPEPTLNRDATVAVSPTYTYNEDMSQAPRGVKLILLGASGVAVLTEYNGKNPFWVGWAALPRRAGGGV